MKNIVVEKEKKIVKIFDEEFEVYEVEEEEEEREFINDRDINTDYYDAGTINFNIF